MDRDKKLLKLIAILNAWLKYSKLWTKVDVKIVSKTNLLTASYKKVTEYGEEKTIMTSTQYERIPLTEYICVTYSGPKDNWKGKIEFQSIEFPMEKLDKRIEHYENKVKYLAEKK